MLPLDSLRQLLRQLLPEGAETALDLIGGQYPAFVYGAERLAGRVPAFCFHSVEPEPFEALLDFLARNDYHTVTPKEPTRART